MSRSWVLRVPRLSRSMFWSNLLALFVRSRVISRTFSCNIIFQKYDVRQFWHFACHTLTLFAWPRIKTSLMWSKYFIFKLSWVELTHTVHCTSQGGTKKQNETTVTVQSRPANPTRHSTLILFHSISFHPILFIIDSIHLQFIDTDSKRSVVVGKFKTLRSKICWQICWIVDIIEFWFNTTWSLANLTQLSSAQFNSTLPNPTQPNPKPTWLNSTPH